MDSQSAGTTAENENIAFDWAYINYNSPIGAFRVGYMNDGVWGTVFDDTSTPRSKIAWNQAVGPWWFTVQIVKMTESSYTAKNTGVTTTDLDSDKYCAAFKYIWKGGEAGLLAGLGRDATKRKPPDNYKALFYNLMPYAIAQIGPVKVQAELDYFWGNWQEYESGVGDVKLDSLAVFLDAVADFGMFYAGGTFAYIAGDDPATTDKQEGNIILNNGGRDWDPCLIMWNNERTYWAGSLGGYGGTNMDSPMYNAWFGQIRGGVRPISALDIMASVSVAYADRKPLGVLHNDYGYEVDVIATYKITNNLSYMLGVGYLFTGDYFKGTDDANTVRDDFLVINKLTLTF